MSAAAPEGAEPPRDRLLDAGIRISIRVAEWIGVEPTLRLGEGLGRAWWTLHGPRRERVRTQLTQAFPEREPAWIEGIARAVFVHLGLGLAEGLLLASRHRAALLARVEIEGLEHLEAARKATEEGGVLVLAPHLGSWELAAAKLADTGLPVAAVYRDTGRPAFERALLRIRGEGVAAIPMGPRAGVHFARSLDRGRVVLALLDQRGKPGESIDVRFFGKAAATRLAPIKLARRAGVPIVHGWAQRLPDRRRHRLTVQPALETAAVESDDDEMLRRILQEVTAGFEQAIRATPGQWIWTHRRWRDQPEATDAT